MQYGNGVRAELSRRLPSEAEARKLLEACAGKDFEVTDVTVRPVKKSPAPPFTTSLNLGISQLRCHGTLPYKRIQAFFLRRTVDSVVVYVCGAYGFVSLLRTF